MIDNCNLQLFPTDQDSQSVYMFRTMSFHLREIQESELQKFHSRLTKAIQAKELGHETIDSLQRLRLILFATKYTRK